MTSGVGTAYVDIRPDMSGFVGRLSAGVIGSMGTVERSVGGAMRGTFAKVGGLAAAGLGIGLVSGAVSQIVSVGVQYDRAMSVFRSVTSATAAQMATARAAAVNLGNDLNLPGVSAAGAAEAMTELAKAGLTTQQSIDAARGALQLSIAAQTSEAEAATITANALLTFGLNANKASMVTDLLAGAANASSASMTDIAYGLQMAGAAMKGANVPLNDTITSLTMLANAGIRGSDAGTLMKTAITRLTAPTGSAAKLMKKLGLDMFDTHGKFVGMRSAIVQLQKVFGPMTQKQRAAAIQTLFGADAMRFANIAIDQGVKSWDKYSGQVNKSGQAAALAKAQNAGLGGALDNLQSSLETVGLAVYQKISPAMTSFVKSLTNLVGKLPAAAAAVGAFFSRVMASGPVQSVVTAIGNAFRTAMAALPGIIAAVLPFLGNLWNTIKQAGPPLLEAGQHILSFAAGIGRDLMPVIKVVATILGAVFLVAIKAIAAAIPKVATVLAKVTGFLDQHRVAITSVVVGVTAFIAILKAQQAITIAVGIAQRAFAAATLFMRGAVLAAKVAMALLKYEFLANPIGIIIALVIAFVAAIIYAYKHSETFRNIINSVWNGIKSVIGAVVGWVQNVIQKFGDKLLFLLGPIGAIIYAIRHWDQIVAIVTGVFNAVWNFISGWISRLIGWGAMVVNVITYPWRILIAIVIGLLNVLWGFIQPIISAIVGFIVVRWNNLVHNVTFIVTWLYQRVSAAFHMVWSVAVSVFNAVRNVVVGAFQAVLRVVLPVVQFIWTRVMAAFYAIRGVVTTVMATVRGVITTVWNAISGFVGTVLGRIRTAVSTAFNNVVSAISGAIGRARTAASNLINGVFDAIRGVVGNIVGIGRDLVQGLINGIVGMGGALWNAITSFIADHVPAPVRKLLGLHSPSKVFHEIGRNVGIGLKDGILSTASQVEGAVTTLANKAMDASSGLGNAAVNSVIGNYRAFAPGSLTMPNGPGAPTIRVFIGDRELTDIVRTEVDGGLNNQALQMSYGRRV